MERASAGDFAKLEDMERKGRGTPAPRAATIGKLVRFVERKKKQLVPTEKGLALVWALPDQLKSAKLTAQWEERLGAVERGELSPEDFMGRITEMLSGLVKTYENASVRSILPAVPIWPRDGWYLPPLRQKRSGREKELFLREILRQALLQFCAVEE